MTEISIAQIIFFPILSLALGYAVWILAIIITDHFINNHKEDNNGN